MSKINRCYFEYKEGIHEELGDIYEWFVRFSRLGEDDPYIRPYYCNGDIKDVLNDAEGSQVEVVNCDWTPDSFGVAPYIYTKVGED